MRREFIDAIKKNENSFGIELFDETVEQLADYFELVQENNTFLHLVAPCSPGEFAVRHILESLMLLQYLPENTRFADVGTGAGLPAIPCLIVRHDLRAVLIESKEKKAQFLELALNRLNIADRGDVLNSQFQEVHERNFSVVTCRAIEKFSERLPRLLRWTGLRQFLFFGGPAIERALKLTKVPFKMKSMPLSDQRFLFIDRR